MERREPSYNAEREARIAAFSSIIEQAVQPVLDMKARGLSPIYSGGMLAATEMQLGSGKILFELYEPGNNSILGDFDGICHVTHAATITKTDPFFGHRIQSTVFALTEDRRILRHISIGRELVFAPRVQREIDLDENGALIEFLTSPHLNLGKLETILRLTPEEESSLAEQQEWHAKMEAERAERRRWNEEQRERARRHYRSKE